MKNKTIKRVISLFIVIIISSVFLFGDTIYETDLPHLATNKGFFDAPLVSGIVQFGLILNNVAYFVRTGCTLFAFLCLVFNCFKLWAGTVELKKFYVDSIFKAVMCIFLLTCFEPITDGVVKLATQMGATVAGGTEKINATYVNAYATLKGNLDKGLQNFKEIIKKNAFTASDGKEYISDSLMADLKSISVNKDEIEKWAKENGLNIAHNSVSSKDDGSYQKTQSSGWEDENGNKITAQKKHWYSSSAVDLYSEEYKKINKQFDLEEQKKMVIKLNALREVLDGESLDKMLEKSDDSSTASSSTLKQMFYSPYLLNKKGEPTFFLSPSRLYKTCIAMSDAVAYANSSTINDDSGMIEPISFNPKGNWSFDGVLKLIYSLLYQLGMIICLIIIMAEYTITILEFYLVRALATLLIPLLFLDATKSYAQNILKIIMSYFMKILVVVLCTFFSLGIFLDVLTTIFTISDLSATTTFVLYLSTLLIGTILVLSAPKIANAVMNGSPAVGVGDVANTMRSAAYMGNSINRAAHTATTVGQKAGGLAQKGVRTAMSVGSELKAGADAFRETSQSLSGESSWNRFKASASAGFNTGLADPLRQRVGDKFYKATTGQDKQHFEYDDRGIRINTGHLAIGDKFIDEKGNQQIATFADVQKYNDYFKDRNIANKLDKYSEKNNQKDYNPPL